MALERKPLGARTGGLSPSPTNSLGSRISRPAPAPLASRPPAIGEDEAEDEQDTAPQASAEAEETQDDAPVSGPVAAPQHDDVPAPPKNAGKRGPKGPRKPKVTLGHVGEVDLAAVRAEARALEQEGRRLAGEFASAMASLKQQYEPKIDALRKQYVEVQAKIAAATFGS